MSEQTSLDRQAVKQYEEEALRLGQRIEDDRARGRLPETHPEMAESIKSLEMIEATLSAAKGKGGRLRKFDDSLEKARKSVSKAIDEAIAKIETHAPKTADHLKSTIKKGTWMFYLDGSTRWKF